MSNETSRFKVTLEFEVDIGPISVPDLDAFMKLDGPGPAKQKKPMSESDWRAAMKQKGMTDADIDKALAAGKKAGAKGAAGKGLGENNKAMDPQMLLYPSFENWAAVQQALQQEILNDDSLSTDYVREMVRDLTRGQIETMIDNKYGAPDLHGVLKAALQRIPTADQATLMGNEESQLFDETELVDDSVDCGFVGLTVTRA